MLGKFPYSLPVLFTVLQIFHKVMKNKILNTKTRLSILWILVMFDMIFADIFTIMYIIRRGSLLAHYLIIASIEVIMLLVIIVTAFKWEAAVE